MLEYLTAGESHGKGLVAIIRGIPAGLMLTAEYINEQLARRQQGFGRGGRMKIEKDKVEIISGLRHGKTLGTPIAFFIRNRDWENWEEIMSCEPRDVAEPFTRPRPGHADLSGAIKFDHEDIRNVLERASARETAIRVAVGAVARRFLEELGIRVGSYVLSIGSAGYRKGREEFLTPEKYESLFQYAESSIVRAGNPDAELDMIDAINQASLDGDTLGGVFEVIVLGAPVGLGSHVHWDEKLDGNIARALMSIQAIKSVEIGAGFECARSPGSQVHDEIIHNGIDFKRKSNRAGGIEGGMTNGEPIISRAAMKPIPTLMKPLMSVDIMTKESVAAGHERSDFCAVPAASVVGEAVVAFEIARAIMVKFGGDNLTETKRNFTGYIEYVERRSKGDRRV